MTNSNSIQVWGCLIGLFTILLIAAIGANALSDENQVNESATLELPQIIEKIKRSIALIEVKTNIKGKSKKATAFLIHNDGILVTCAHTILDTVIRDSISYIPDTTDIKVRFHHSELTLKAHLLIYREDRDIALIKIEKNGNMLQESGIISVVPGKTTDIIEGLEVACTGYDLIQKSLAFGERQFWLTTHRGIISCVQAIGPAEKEDFLNMFQVDMIITKGASGSPIYRTDNGEVIGIYMSAMGVETADAPVYYGIGNCQPSWSFIQLALKWLKENDGNDDGS